MLAWFELTSLVLGAYLLGSVCSAILVCRAFGLPDPRSTGSSNPGATNVMRLGGKVPALLTFLGDALKGIPPIALGRWLGLDEMWLGWIALAAILGHLYPVYFRFQGGKGVATAFGILLGLSWPLCLIALASWATVFAVSRVSSLASLLAFVLMVPVVSYFYAPALLTPLCVMALLILWRHRQNIRDLWAGKERHFEKN